MAVTIDPFAFATAILSEDYVGVFAHPEIVSKYLEKISDTAGVKLQTSASGISIKGSWVSLNRAHVFLTEFLATYQKQPEEDKKDVDLIDQSQCFSDIEDSNEIEETFPVTAPSHETRFHDGTEESSDWLKWTAEVLPQIQRARSKRAQAYAEPQSQADKVPEPLVLYANYQPTPDPAAKKPPTLDAIEKVLKTVYDKDKLVESISGAVIPVPSTEDVNFPQESHIEQEASEKADSAGLCVQFSNDSVNQDQVLTSDTVHDSDIKPQNMKSRSLSENKREVSQVVLDVPTNDLSENLDEDVMSKKMLSCQQFSESGDLTLVQKENSSTDRKNKTPVKRPSRRKRKVHCKKKSDVSVAMPAAHSVEEANLTDQGKPLLVETDIENAEMNIATQGSTVVRNTRRKGRPQKNVKYQIEMTELKPYNSCVSYPSRADSAAKHKNRTNAVVKGRLSETSPVKKRGRPAQIKSNTVKEEELCKDFVCNLCSYVAKKLSHLREHKRRVHITREFKCDKCGKVFGFGKDLKRHYLTHQKAENCCDICGKMYKGIRTLAEHKKTHETNYVKPEFPCEFCKKIFSTKYVLAYHIKSEHLGIKKTYLCPTCGKSFSQKNSYLQHANVHMGIKPYQCDICGRSFSYEKSLKEHKYMHEDNKQFECHVCHKKFRQSSGVAIHMKIHKERKDYVCSACGKGFSQKQALIRHERIHLGEKPFACVLCKRTFTDSSILRRHMILIHKKDKSKWQEDTENNVQRRTDFFISIIGKDGKMKKSEVQNKDLIEPVRDDSKIADNSEQVPDSNPVLMGESENSAIHSCPSESMEDSFNFIPVGIGTMSSLPQPTFPEVPGMTMATVPPLSVAPEVTVSHLLSESSTASTLSVHSCQTVSVPADLKLHSSETNAVFTTSLGQAVLKDPSSQPMDMSPQNHMHPQSSGILNSHLFSDSQRIASELYPSELQQGDMNVAGVSLPQYSGVMTPGNSSYHPVMVMMSDALNTLTFHSTSVTQNVTTVSHSHPADYDNLTHPSVQQQQFPSAQRH